MTVKESGGSAARGRERNTSMGSLEQKCCSCADCWQEFTVVLFDSANEALIGDLHRDLGLEFSFEGAVKDGGEQGVELGGGLVLQALEHVHLRLKRV